MALKQGGAGADILLGTAYADLILGYEGDDVLKGLGGSDVLLGGLGADWMLGGDGNDAYYVDNAGDDVIENAGEGIDTIHSSVDYALPDHVEKLYLTGAAVQGIGNDSFNHIEGNDNNNVLKGLGGNDSLNGGGGDDVIYGGADSDEIDGGEGADVMYGGDGVDDFIVDNLGDEVHGGSGTDQVWSSVDFWLPADAEELLLMSGPAVIGFGNDSNNLIWGNNNANVLSGLGGTDTIRGGGGDDNIDGCAGLDVLFGGTGRDVLTGGTGLDFFVWNDIAETGVTPGTADVITDFNIAEGDRINLGLVDADVYTDGNQAFTFIGMAAFSGTPGEINYYHSGGNTYIQLQTGMSADVEGVICLEGIHDPEAFWFIA
jgi:Ca2+-binding RTX toxin-like protein